MLARISSLALLVAGPALALDDPQTKLQDPMRSGNWDYHQIEILGDPKEIRFDDRVRVTAPPSPKTVFTCRS